MSTPKPSGEPWHENWADAFEGGFYDNLDGAEEKKALLVETDAQGRTKVVGVATGAEAEKLIAEAQASGLEVRQDATRVEQLEETSASGLESATDVPPEIYDLMATVIHFAQEMTQEWVVRDGAQPVPRPSISGEIEFSHEDVEGRIR